MTSTFNAKDMKAFETTSKVGLLATVNPEGLPHISLITSIQAGGPDEVLFGQFTEGHSKTYVNSNPKTAFLIMTLDKSLWTGRADYSHAKREGEEYEMFNNKPMFRYNSYFGIHTVHFMDLIEVSEKQGLPLLSIVAATLLTKTAKGGAKTGVRDRILTPFGEKLFNGLDSLKYISWIADDGYPVLVPVIQCQAADSRRLAFSPLAYRRLLKDIPEGAEVAIFGLTMQMENVLARGRFSGYSRKRGVRLGLVDLDWIYNSMPSKHGQIYPLLPLEAVEHF